MRSLVDKISIDDLWNTSLYKICMQKHNINKNTHSTAKAHECLLTISFRKVVYFNPNGWTFLVICKPLFYVKSSAFRNWKTHTKFKIITTLKVKSTVFWDMMLCSLEHWHQHSWGTCHFHLQGTARFLQNASTYIPNYTMSLTSKQTVILTGFSQGKHDFLLNWWFYNFMVEREFKTRFF